MTSKNKKLQISCDGGAATGKSTGAKLIANGSAGKSATVNGAITTATTA